MTKKQLDAIKKQLKDKKITLISLAKEYGCSNQFIHLVFSKKATSKPLLDFIQKKIEA